MDRLDGLYARLAAAFQEESFPGPLVFGDGLREYPRLMLVGEAPGAQEALQGKPFVGKAGKNLTEFLEKIGLGREEIFITNVVKIRPFRISPKGTVSNRPPTAAEKAFFLPWLMEEKEIVRPGLVVTLGNVALQAFGGGTIGEVHGRVIHTDRAEELFPLYHPASVIYNPALKETYARDLQELKELL